MPPDGSPDRPTAEPDHEAPGRGIGFGQLMSYGPETADILIVEDEPDVRRSIQRLVEALGHRTRTAGSAEEADAWLGSQRFHACMLDVELPKMKGVEFLKWALSRDPEMAVVMLTGIDDPDVALDCLSRGARAYLVKPVEADFLEVALRDALAVRRILTERNELESLR